MVKSLNPTSGNREAAIDAATENFTHVAQTWEKCLPPSPLTKTCTYSVVRTTVTGNTHRLRVRAKMKGEGQRYINGTVNFTVKKIVI